jgi:hypothetical protein
MILTYLSACRTPTWSSINRWERTCRSPNRVLPLSLWSLLSIDQPFVDLLLGLAEILVIPPSWEFILAEKTKFKAISAYLGFVLASDMSVREDDGTFVGDFTCSTAWKIELEYVCERVSIWRKEEVAINRSNHPCKSLLWFAAQYILLIGQEEETEAVMSRCFCLVLKRSNLGKV